MTYRVLRAIIVVTAFAVVAFAIPLGLAVARIYHAEEVTRLERVASAAGRDVSPDSIAGGDEIDLPPSDDLTKVSVFSPAGARIAGDGPETADSRVQQASSGGVNADGRVGSDLVVAVPVIQDEVLTAVIRASVPRSVIDRRVWHAWLLMLGLGALVAGAAFAIAIVEARRLGRPVKRLADTATRLGHGDFTVTAQRSGVTEIDEAGAALEATASRLGAALARERAFSTDASHQLRTPLTGLRLRLEGALNGANPTMTRVLADSLKDVDRLQETIDDLLELARDLDERSVATPISPMLDAMERVWRGRLAAMGRPLRISIEEPVTAVALSGAALRQILEVLLSNAVTHGSGTVAVRARALAGGTAVDVEDDGQPPDTDPEKLFVRRSPDASGTGIGLSLARSLAEAEGARLIADLTGSRTRFSLITRTPSP